MHRNAYDSDNTVFSPQGRLHQVEYALEAVKQGSAAVGLRSSTHVVLLALKRSTGELASYQKKIIRVDDHIGVAIAGLTSDARVLSNSMRTMAMSSRMLYDRAIPVSRIVGAMADKAQTATQQYGRRPYGVGFLVSGYDDQGPHLYELSPAGTCYEYVAMSIGARSQSAKTYLESNYEQFEGCDLNSLIKHGLHALRETLQQDKELTTLNTSIAIVGKGESGPAEQASIAPKPLGKQPRGLDRFRILEGDDLKPYLDSMDPRDDSRTTTTATVASSEQQPAASTDQPAAQDGASSMETD